MDILNFWWVMSIFKKKREKKKEVHKFPANSSFKEEPRMEAGDSQHQMNTHL